MRRVNLRVKSDLLCKILEDDREQDYYCAVGIPQGATIIDAFYERGEGVILLLVEHPSYADIMPGEPWPEIELEIHDFWNY